jgi:hypothetical protein
MGRDYCCYTWEWSLPNSFRALRAPIPLKLTQPPLEVTLTADRGSRDTPAIPSDLQDISCHLWS